MAEPKQIPAQGEAPPHGLLHALRQWLATLLATVRTRGELLQVELEEERLRVAGIVLFAAAALVFFALALLLLSFFVILLYWDTHRVAACGLLALGYLVAGAICVGVARKRAAVKSKLFSESLAQLRRDGEQLTGQ